MARETEFTEIDEQKYSCSMMPGTKGNKTLVELIDMVGRPVVVMASNALRQTKPNGKDPTMGIELGIDSNLSDLVQLGTHLLFERLTPEQADATIKAVLDGVSAEGVGDLKKKEIFDEHFRGRIWHLWKVFAWSLEVNYRDFFEGLRSNMTIQRWILAGSKVWGPQTSTSKSGESSPPQT